MKIAIIQIYDNNIKEYAQYSQMINSMYASKHGYYYLNWDYDLVPLSCSVYYNKIVALIQTFEEQMFEWVLYLDADAIITNDNIKIEDIINKHSNKEIILAADKNGIDGGVILIKNTENMYNLLKAVFNDKRYFHTKTPEQYALLSNVKEQYLHLFDTEECWLFSGYLDYYANHEYHTEKLWCKDSFILHAYCLPSKVRKQIFQEFLQEKNIYCFTKKDD